MTTTTSVPTRQASRLRIGKVMRLHYINRWTFVWTPMIVFVAAWVVTVAIVALLRSVNPSELEGENISGGAQAPFWYFLVVAMVAMTTTFPFSQALSITRKEFFLGTMATAVVSIAALAAVYTVLGLVEERTDGYGIGAYFSNLGGLWQLGWFVVWLVFFTIGMFAFVIGFWLATLFKRFGTRNLTFGIIGVAIILLGIVALITWLGAWPDVLEVIMTLGVVGMTCIGLGITVLLGIGSYLTLRRLPA